MKTFSSFRQGAMALSLCFILTGCQQGAVSAPTSAEQVEQLSSLIAGGSYLREQCAKSSLPNDDTLKARALGLAEKRGWNTYAADYQKLSAASETKMRQLTDDPRPKQEKCRRLADSLWLFTHEDA